MRSHLGALLVVLSLCAVGPCVSAQARPDDPAALVQLFYDSYPNELEGGLPEGEDLQWISRFLSGRLYQLFRDVLAYQQEWIRQNPDDPPMYLKPPYADGVSFNGFPDAIVAFRVLRAEPRAPGVWHVPVYFWHDLEYDHWEAVVVVKEERGAFAIDDFIFVAGDMVAETWCISESLDWRKSE